MRCVTSGTPEVQSSQTASGCSALASISVSARASTSTERGSEVTMRSAPATAPAASSAAMQPFSTAASTAAGIMSHTRVGMPAPARLADMFAPCRCVRAFQGCTGKARSSEMMIAPWRRGR